MRKKTGLILTAGFLMAAMITGCGGKNTDVPDTQEAQQTESDTEAEAEAPAPIEVDMANYESIIASLPEGYYYAFADIDKDNDALLVAAPDYVFDDLDGNKNAKGVRIYGYDKDGNIIDYGFVESSSTANPMAVKDGKLYYATHTALFTAYIDEASSELVTEENESFEDYEGVTVIAFTTVDGKEAP